MRIVNGDNFNRDDDCESFVHLPPLDKELADTLCEKINEAWSGNHAPRHWKVVDDDYELSTGPEA